MTDYKFFIFIITKNVNIYNKINTDFYSNKNLYNNYAFSTFNYFHNDIFIQYI